MLRASGKIPEGRAKGNGRGPHLQFKNGWTIIRRRPRQRGPSGSDQVVGK